jgi:hypothetical protein
VAERLYHRSPSVEETTVGERFVLYHCGTGTAVVLNPTASLLWKGLRDAAGRDALSDLLHAQFPHIELTRVQADTRSALDAMEKHQLVVSS